MFKIQISTQTKPINREKMLQMKKSAFFEKWFEVSKLYIHPSMHKSIYFENMNPLELKGQWGHCGTNKTCWISVFASISYKANNINKISSKKVY